MIKIGYDKGQSANNNIYQFLLKHVRENPEKKILTWTDRQTLSKWLGNTSSKLESQSISVGDLYKSCEQVSTSLSKLGVKSGDRVILFAPMSVPLYTFMFSLQKIGAIPVFLDSWARRDQLGVSADVASPVLMVSFKEAFEMCSHVPELAAIEKKIIIGENDGSYLSSLDEIFQMQHEKFVAVEPVEQEHTGLITFTTGSSGTPKGANRTHRFLAAQHYALNRELKYVPEDVDMPVFPIFSLNNLAEGVNTVLPAFDVGRPSDFDAPIILAQMKANNITCITLSPSLFNNLSRYCLDNNIELSDVKRVVTGGAPISRDNLIDFKKVAPSAEILVLYGSTEVEPIAHIKANDFINQKFKGDQDPELVDDGVNVGKIDEELDYKFIKITKESLKVGSQVQWKELSLEKGEVGELIVSGEHVCNGYYNNEEAFERAKIKDYNGVIWHRTGDLGKLDNENNLWLVGRVHNAIKRDGKFHFPVKAEIILKRLEGVSRGAYLGVEDQALGEKVICVLELKDGASKEIVESEVKRLFQKNEVAFDHVVFHSKIPLDPRHQSKVEYGVLRKELIDNGLV